MLISLSSSRYSGRINKTTTQGKEETKGN